MGTSASNGFGAFDAQGLVIEESQVVARSWKVRSAIIILFQVPALLPI
jgi:hypothetical protein